LLVCLPAWGAAAIGTGDVLPPLRVEKLGELHVDGEEVRYAPWDSGALQGMVQVVQYMAARPGSRDLNKPFTDRLKDSGIPIEHYHVTTIVNLDDALFGSRGIVVSELEKNKKRYYRSSIVADEAGLGLEAWRLAPKSSAIIILDAGGRVAFFREGAMSAQEIEQALALVRAGAADVAGR
jgi:YtfJ family uncharacterized protein